MLVLLGLFIAILFGGIAAGTTWGSASWFPKLALDLEGGTQIILTPTTKDDSAISSEDLNEAISIIRQRVDSSGVAEAEITSQAGRNIIVSIPGKASQSTIDLISQSAVMRFRPVLAIDTGSPQASATDSPTATATASDGAGDGATDGATDAADPEATPTETDAAEDPTATADPTPTATSTGPATQDEIDAFMAANPELGATDQTWLSFPGLVNEWTELDCSDSDNLVGGGGDAADQPLVTCSQDGSLKYALGPVVIEGVDISKAQAGLRSGANGVQTNTWVVNLEFNSKGSEQFAAITKQLATLTQPANQFAIVLDNLVVSAPSVSAEIPNGQAEISGSFTRETATTLGNQLSFGSLPLTFTIESESQISATLGSEHLEKGLLAGLIGLILVVVYSLLQYRGLGAVTVASLIIATAITYGLLVLLGWLQGYRLSLPGVAGVIVSIGITADSFIVYFERIRDEVRDGRGLAAAVDFGWKRARRTILASDTVNLIAAITLYFLAVGGVQGFAFTLGLTTLVDLVVVFMFTHPLMVLLTKTRFFGNGHRMSGLDPVHLGRSVAVYRGRGEIRPRGTKSPPRPTGDVTHAPADGSTMTIAERRAAQQAAESETGTNEEA